MQARLYATALAVALVAAGCGGGGSDGGAGEDQGSPTAANRLEVTMREYSFVVDGEVGAGPAILNFTNEGSEFHHAIIGKLDEGKTLTDVQELLEKGLNGPPPPWFDDQPIDQTLISPGRTAGVVSDLEEGTYALLCFMPDPKGVPHVEHGMAQTFVVEAGSDGDAIEPDDSVAMTAEGADAPTLPSGESILEVTNDDEIEGEVYIAQLAEGQDPAAVDAWFQSGQKGPAPVEFFGGTHAFKPGESVMLALDLEPGTYSIVASYGEGKDITDAPTEFTVEG